MLCKHACNSSSWCRLFFPWSLFPCPSSLGLSVQSCAQVLSTTRLPDQLPTWCNHNMSANLAVSAAAPTVHSTVHSNSAEQPTPFHAAEPLQLNTAQPPVCSHCNTRYSTRTGAGGLVGCRREGRTAAAALFAAAHSLCTHHTLNTKSHHLSPQPRSHLPSSLLLQPGV